MDARSTLIYDDSGFGIFGMCKTGAVGRIKCLKHGNNLIYRVFVLLFTKGFLPASSLANQLAWALFSANVPQPHLMEELC